VPRIFSEQDRAALRQALIDEGRRRFLRDGLRKTRVEQLARTVGIAKGTFYSFFGSKEDLCAAIFEQEEEQRRGEFETILASDADPIETLRSFLAFSLEFIRHDSLAAALRERGELAQVFRGADRERTSEHFDHDVLFVGRLLAELRRNGAARDVDARIATGVMRAVAVLGLHEDEVGSDVFPEVMERLIAWVATGIVANGAPA